MTRTTPNVALPAPESTDSVLTSGDLWALALATDASIFGLIQDLLGGRFYRRTLTSDDSLDALDSGAYSVHSGSLATELGFPVGAIGSVIIIKGNDTSKTALFMTRELTPQLWANSRLSSAWGGWVRWDAGAADRWYDPAPLTASEHLDNISVSGIRTCWSGSVATEIGAPVGLNFDVETVLWGTGAGRQRLITRNLSDPQEYVRHLFSVTWGGWKRVDAGAAASGSTGLLPASPTALKRSAMSATTGYGGAQVTGQGWAREVVHIPAGVTRARIGVRNWNPRYDMTDSPAASLSKISIGPRNGNTSQATSWTQVATTGSTGTDGYISKWFTLPAGISNSDALIAYGWQSTVDVQMNLGYGYTGATASEATTGTGISANRLPFFVYLELESQPTVPTVASFTDSIGVGVSATRELYDSWLDQYCRQNGYIPMHWGHSGDSGMSWENPGSKKFKLYGTEINQVDAVLYAMGSNQLSQSVTPTLQEMIDTATKCVENLRKQVSPNVYGCTITPRTNVTGDFETRRREFNAWMKSSPLFQDVFDMSAAVSLDDETLNPAYDADGIHLNTAGYAAMAAAITRPVVNRGITVSETAGRTVHVWDTVNQREQLIYGYTGVRDISALVTGLSGQVLLSRDGNNVTLEFNNVSPTISGLVDFIYLPQGFRVGRTTYRWLQAQVGGMSRSLQLYASGNSRINSADPSDSYRQSFTFPTLDPWPISLPGTPA